MAHPIRTTVLQAQAARAAAEAYAHLTRGQINLKSYLTALLASSALLGPAAVHAQAVLPQGGKVVGGSAAITTTGATTTVTQTSNRAIVDWTSFSVGQGDTVQFVQPNAQSAILNRVTGSTTSTIAGQITGNGQVYLVNPNGIVITSTGTVELGGGFVASTLAIADRDFMNGKLAFYGHGPAATVSNAGAITIGKGGFAALLGGAVANSGTIAVPMGKIALNAGESVTLDLSGDGFLQVAVPGAGAAVTGHAAGGRIALQPAAIVAAVRDTVRLPANLRPGTARMEGTALVLGDAAGTTLVAGKLDVSSSTGQGGSIAVGGAHITLSGASIDASGATGGGTVSIGGGSHGATVAGLTTAQTVSIDAGSTINANSTQSGNGGQVTIWSDKQTSFAGTISAQALGAGGNGGNAEVSGASLHYTGTTNLLAAFGKTGNLLLDPYDVTISSSADSGYAGFSATAESANINTATLQTALSSANVTISTGSGGAYTGNITVASALNWSANTTLTLSAAGGIILNAGIAHSGTGSGLTLNSAGGAGISGSGNIAGNGATVFNNASGTVSSYSGIISGSGSLAITGNATMGFGSASTFTGGTTISGNVYAIAYNSAAFGTGTVTINANSGLGLWFAGGGAVANNIVINSAGVAGNLTAMSGKPAIYGDGGASQGNYTLSGTITLGNATSSMGSYYSGNSVTVTGRLTGAGGLALNGGNSNSGLVILANASNNYTGATQVTYSGATLRMGVANALPAATALTVGSGATFDVAGYATTIGSLAGAGTVTNSSATAATLVSGGNNTSTTFSGVIQNGNGTLGLTQNGSGTLTLSGANTYSGTTTVSAGTLQVVNTSTSAMVGRLGSGAVTVLSGAVLQFINSDTIDDGYNITNAISGAGSLLFSGPDGAVTELGSANTYTGGTTISSGIVNVSSNTALGFGSVTMTGGALRATNSSRTLSNSFTLGGTIGLGGQTSISGPITLAGNTTITASENAGGSTWSGAIATNGYSLAMGNTGPNVDGGSWSGQSLALSGVISGSGSITQNSSGTLLLSGANTYTGATTVSAGTLQAGSAAAFGTNSAVSMASGATLDLAGKSVTIGSLAGAGTVTDSSTTAVTLSTGGNGTSTTYAGVLQNGAGALALTQNGSGTLTLTGANTFSGGVNLNAGVVNVGSGGALGTAGTISFGGGTLQYSAANQTDYSGRFSAAGSQSWSIDTNGQTISYASVLGGTGNNLTKLGSGTLLLSGANTYTGTTTVSAGTLIATVNTTQNSIGTSTANIAAGATLEMNNTNTNLAASSVTIGNTFTGAGTLNLNFNDTNPNNTYMSGITGLTGNINLTATGTTGDKWNTQSLSGAIAASVTVNSGTTLYDNKYSVTFNGGISVVGSGNSEGFGALRVDSGNTLGGNITLLGDATIASRITSGVISGTITSGVAGNVTLTANSYSGVSLTLSGSIANGAGTVALAMLNPGVVSLTGANTYSGATTVSAGTLQAGSATAFGNGSAVSVASGATLDLNGNSVSIGSLAGAGTVTDGSTTAATLSVGGYGLTPTVFSGLLQDGTGGLSLTINGDGNSIANDVSALTLSGANTFTGNVSIGNSGQLILTNSGALGLGTKTVTIGGGYAQLQLENNITINSNIGFITSNIYGTIINVSGNNNINGYISLIGGGGGTTLVDTSGVLTLNGTISISSTAGSRPLVFDSTNSIVINGSIQDGTVGRMLSLQINGPGSVTLTGANTFTGGVNIYSGVLNVGSSGALGTSGAINFGGGTLQYSAANQTDYSGRFVSASAQASIGTQAWNIDTNGQNVTFASVLGGTGSTLTKLGTGTLTLSADNTYTGATTVNAGTLVISGVPYFDVGRATTIASGAMLELYNSNNSLSTQMPLSTIYGAGTLQFAGNSSYSQAGGGVNNQNRLIMSMSAGGLIDLEGTSKLVNGGWQTILWTNNLASLNIAANASFDVWDGNTVYVNALTGSGSIVKGIGGNAGIVVGVNNGSGTFAGAINPAYGTISITKVGSGTQTIAGTNTSTGAVTVSAGTLRAGSTTALGVNSAVSVASGATLDLNGNSVSIGSLAGAGTVTDSSAAAVMLTSGSNNTSTTFSGIVKNGSGTLGLSKAGTGTFTLSGANTYTGATTVSAGTLQAGSTTAFGANSAVSMVSGATLDLNGNSVSIGSLAGGGTVTDNNAAAATLNVGGNRAATTFSGLLQNGTGVLSLTVLGDGAGISNDLGALTLTGANTFTGAVTVNNSGQLTVTNSTALGTGSKTVSVQGYYNQIHLQNNITISSAITFSLSNYFGVLFSDSGNNTINGNININGGGSSSLITAAAGTLTINGNMPLVASTRQLIFGGAGSIVVNGAILDGTPGNQLNLQTNGPGTVTFNGANTFSGGLYLNGGVLNLGSSGALGTSGTIIFQGGTLQYSAANHTDYSGRFVSTGNQAWNIDTNGQNVTFASVLAGTGSILTKLGAGTLTLAGTDTYTGTTTVNAGTLTLAPTGSLNVGNAAATVSVAAGAALTGTGTVTAGTLSISGTGLVSLTGNNAIAALATSGVVGAITLNDTAALTVGSVATNGSALVLNDTGTITVSGATITTQGGAVSLTSSAGGISLVSSSIATGNGALSLIATGATSGPAVTLSGVTLDTGMGLGTISGASTAGAGVVLTGANSLATTNTASGITITGLGGGANDGVQIAASATLATTGTVTINGSSLGGIGIDFLGGNTITDSAGNLTLAGGGATNAGPGIYGTGALTFANAGTGALVVSGTSSGGYGVQISGGAKFTTTNSSTGVVNLTGSGVGSGGDIFIATSGAVTLGAGAITGTGGAGIALTSSVGPISLAGTTVNAGAGTLTIAAPAFAMDAASALYGTNVTLNADTMALGGPIGGTGALILAPYTASTAIGIGDGQPGGLILGNAALSQIQPGFASITIGSPNGTGAIMVGSWTANAPLTIEAGGPGGTITLNGALATSPTAPQALNLIAGSAITDAGASLTTGGGAITLTAPVIALAGNINTNGGLLSVNASSPALLSGSISGSGGLANIGTGTLTLSGANTYSGATQVTGGAVNLTGSWTPASGSAAIAVASGTAMTGTGTINASALTVSGAGTINLSGNNAVGTLSGSGTLASVNFNNAQSIALGSLNATGAIAVTTTPGSGANITVLSNGGLTSAASGQAIVVAADGAFINNAGSGALSASSGNWLVYSSAPSADTFGGLDSANTAVWNTANGASVSQAGNRYAFAYQPTVTFASTNASKIYGTDGSSMVAGAFTVSGIEAGVSGAYLGDTAAIAYSGAPVVSSAGSASTATVLGGPYAITVAQGSVTGLNGYAVAFASPGSLTIGKANLTLTGNTTATTYNGSAQTNNYTITSGHLYGSDAISAVAGQASGTNAGTYTDTLGNATGSGLANYNVTYVNGSLTIGKASLTLTGANTATTYNGQAQANSGATLSGVQGTDSFAITGQATGTNAGTYTDTLGVTATGATLASNYTVTVANQGSLTIGKANLTLTGNTTATTYNGSAQTNGYTITSGHLYGNDAISAVAGQASGTNAGTYTDTLGNATGSGLANYNVTYVNGSLTIGKASLTLTGANTATTYNGQAQANSGATLSGVQGTDSFAITGQAIGTNAGTYTDTLGVTATGATLASNYTVTVANQGSLTIGKANLTLTGNTTATTYNGAAQTNGYTITSGHLYGNDAISAVAGQASGTNAGTYTDTLGNATGSGLANYNVTYVNGSLTIGKASLTLTGANTATTYNGQAQANSGATLSGVQGTDSFAITGQATGTNAGTYTDTLGVTATGATLASNYTVTVANQGSLTIGKANLTLTGNTTATTYNGAAQTNGYTITSGHLYGNDAISAVAGQASGTNAGTYTDTLGNATGSGLANYNVTYVNGSLTIGKASLTLTGANTATTYNGQAQANSGATLSGVQGTDSFAITGQATGTNAGTYTDTLGVTATGATLASNYTVTVANQGSLTIGKANLTLTGNTTATTYNGSAQTNNYTITSGHLYGSDAISAVAGQASGTNAGTYTDTLGNATGSGLANYNVTYVNGSLTIGKASLTLTGANTATTYNGQAQANSGATLSGVQGTDSFAITGQAIGTNAGTYTDTLGVTATGATLASNYTVTVANQGSLTIGKANLTLTGNTTATTYNGAAQTNGYTITAGHLYGNDAISAVAGQASGTNAGTYTDTLGNATGSGLANYNVTYVNGSLTIGKASLTLTGANTATTYNGQAQANSGATLSGVQGTDSFAITGQAIGTNAGTYTDTLGVTATGATLASNYTVTVANQGSLTIGKANLTLTGNTTATTYNGAAQTNGYTITAGHLYGNDAISAVAGQASGTNAGTYTDTLGNATGSGLANYNVTYVNGSLTIGKASLTLTGANTATTYNGQAQANSGATLSGVQGTDSFAITGQAIGTNAGTYTDTLGVTATGATLASNYTVTVANQGSLTIGKANLTLTGNTTATTYNGAAQTNGYTITAGHLYGNDAISAVAGQASGTNAGTYTDTLGNATGSGLANYNVTYVNGSLTIGKASLTLTGANTATTYNGQAQANSGATLSGVQGTDSFAITGQAIGTNAGTYTDTLGVTATGATLASNYTVTVANQGSLTIGKANLTLTGNTTATTYNGSAQTNGYTITSGHLYGNDAISAVAGQASGTNAGTYTDTLGNATGSGLANYNVTYVNGSLTIGKASLTLTGANTATTYNGQAQANSGATLSGVQGTDSFAITGQATGTNAGTYTDTLGVTATGATLASNYTVTVANQGSLTIGKANLTLTGNTTATTYNGAAQTNGYTITAGHLYGNDAISAVAGQASGTNAGTYTDTLGNATGSGLANYNVTYVNGSLTIGKASLTLTGANTATTYNGQAQANSGATLSGVQGTDSFAITGQAIGTNAGTYTDTLGVTATGATLASNYTVTVANQGSLTIGKANLTLTGNTTATTYNGAAQTNGYTITAGHLYGNDAISAVAGQASGTNAGTYTDTLGNATGSGLANYNVTYVNGSLTIGKASLTLTGANTATTYNGQAQANSGATLSGVQGTDSFAITGQAIGTNAGTYTDTLGVTATGATLASNYTVTVANQGSLTIGKANLTLTGNTTATTYNGSAQTNGYTITSGHLYGNDAISAVAGQASGTNAGTYTDTLGNATGSGLANYNVTYVNGSLTIGKASLTLTGANTATTYNGQAQANSGATLSGVQGTDSFAITGQATGTNAGTYTDTLGVTATGATLASNYTVTVAREGVLTIAPGTTMIWPSFYTATQPGTSGPLASGHGSDSFAVTSTLPGLNASATETSCGTTAQSGGSEGGCAGHDGRRDTTPGSAGVAQINTGPNGYQALAKQEPRDAAN